MTAEDIYQLPFRHRGGEWDDPEVGRGDIHETLHADGHVVCGDFRPWFWNYLSRSEDRALLGRAGHVGYRTLKDRLLQADRRAYRAFVAMAEMRSTLLEVAVDMGISKRTVQRLLDKAAGMGLRWQPIKHGSPAPVESRDELRVMGMLEPIMREPPVKEGNPQPKPIPLCGYSVQEIAGLQGLSEDQVRGHIRSAREKRKGHRRTADLDLATFFAKNGLSLNGSGAEEGDLCVEGIVLSPEE